MKAVGESNRKEREKIARTDSLLAFNNTTCKGKPLATFKYRGKTKAGAAATAWAGITAGATAAAATAARQLM